MIINFLIFIILEFTPIHSLKYDCSSTEYNRCVKIADPLVKEIHLIFPDNLDDVDRVCTTWNHLINCLSTYTGKCFTYQERNQFNKAVRSSIESVHQMCNTDSGYQKEYLRYAPCLKSTITDREHCGYEYNTLVNQVSRGDDISRATLCCTHEKFKRCVSTETTKLCDGGIQNGPATRFSGQVIEKALSFIQDQCFNYIPSSNINCEILLRNDYFTDSTFPSSITTTNILAKELPPLNKKSTITPWLPSTSIQFTPVVSESSSGDSNVDTLGSRSRPSSYGRSSSWSDFSETPNFPTTNFEQSTTYSPDFSSNGWVVSNYPSKTDDFDGFSTQQDSRTFSEGAFTDSDPNSVQTWYPAAGDQIENEVEEPNQQGLVKRHNGGGLKMPVIWVMVITAILTMKI
ncbi:uncharacterized protein [Onthophagus taurus]|uniref:uncharacterized protein n=1 Tax=Onthophagus taurus TaxID=166361 RepID=UPI000C1FFF03|nr:uncharacterized protein LOC111422241 [Onthophagus taurus]